MVRKLLVGVGLSVLLAAPAFAQTSVPGPIATPGGQPATARGHRKVEPAPAGVPGARAEPALNAPAERGMTDMPPTEALFDAINRGDTVAARDAIGRGADINGRNILGLTPLEQSVDLGRSDISFLLLSLRGGAGYSTTEGPRAAKPDSKTAAAAARAERQAETREAARSQRQQAAADRAARTAPVAPRNARLFAGDGGAPVPQAGFLGFDAAR